MPHTTTVLIQLTIDGHALEAAVAVPTGPATPRDLLPILQNLTDTVVQIATQTAAAQGQSVSCKKGCGACCRQMVPISEAEAEHMAELINAMPPDRRRRIKFRFTRALKKLAAAGLLEKLENRHSLSQPDLHAIDQTYFNLAIPCPFLEDESCSIHPQRPLACREYLVTSPAENCSNPVASAVRQLPLPAKISALLTHADGSSPGDWIPLVLTRKCAQRENGPMRAFSGPSLLRDVLSRL